MNPRLLCLWLVMLLGGPSAFAIDFGSVNIDLGYLYSCWAKAEEPKTLTALHQLRPAHLPDHPMAQWVADRLIRDTGATPQTAAIQEVLKDFQKRGNFWVRDGEDGLWISNGKVGVAFLGKSQGAAIASLYNVETGTECIFKNPEASTPWRLRVLKPSPNGKTWPGLVSAFPKPWQEKAKELNQAYLLEVDGGALPAQWEVKENGGEATVTIHWQPIAAEKSRFDVDATITMTSDSPLLRWRANTHRLEGENYTLVALSFPLIRSLSAPKESDFYFSGYARGRGHLFRKVESWDGEPLNYPNAGWTIQFCSLSFGPDTALYLACHDGEAYTKHLGLMSDNCTYIAHAAWDRDKLEMPYDVIMGPIKGDWYDAALIYRDWATKQKWCAKGTLSERVQKGTIARQMVETDYWVRPNWPGYALWKTGVDELQDNLDFFWKGKCLSYPNAKNLPAPEQVIPLPEEPPPVAPKLGVWWYGWEQQEFDTKTPNFDALPGVKEAFTKESALGLSVMPYVQIQAWDITEPSFTAAAKAAEVLGLDGKPSLFLAHPDHPLAYLCPSEPPMSDAGSRLAEYLQKLGANAIYLDTFPPQPACYSPEHGHPLGQAGHWALDADRAILERIKRERGESFGIMMESSTEALMDCVDAQMSWWFVEPQDTPLWPVIYGGYTVVSGATMLFEPPDDMVGFRLETGRPFLWGSQLGRTVWSGYLLYTKQGEFLRKLVYLKAQARKFFVYGRMLRPPQLLGTIPRVRTDKYIVETARFHFDYDAYEAALWLAPDGEKALAIVNFDDKPHNVSFPAKEVFSGPECQMRLLTSQGPQDWKLVKNSDNLTFEIPPGEPQMIIFKP